MGYKTLNLLNLFNEYANDNGLDVGVYDMDMLDMFMEGTKAIDIIGSVERDFNIHSDYFTHNGYLWESLDNWEMQDHVIDNIDRYFTEWLIDNGYIEIQEVEELEEFEELDNYNTNLYDMIDNYMEDYKTFESLLNNFELYLHEGTYYLEQTTL